jgi:gluconate 2-dehydrogenase gamma chain
MFFNTEEAATVEAASARIIPSDGRPGAREAKVIYFIDYMLANAYKIAQPVYREGISKLNEVSQTRFRRPFIYISETEQDDILTRMEQRTLQQWERAGEFFSVIRAHTIEGMFSDPRYHGNSAHTGWILIGETH